MANLKFGVFLPPIHSPRYPVADQIEQDLDLIESLDRFGYNTIWFGEHHSSGYETIPSPEIMLAAAAQRTHRIKVCTGVISLPYHHPMLAAERIAFLDNMTRGRAIFGLGPGALPRDAHMMGMDHTQLRGRMEEALQVILQLFESDGYVDAKSDWFELRDGRIQIRGYANQTPKLTVSSAISPAGARLAGKYGLGLLSVGTSSAEGIARLSSVWSVTEEEAAIAGKTVSRDNWSITDSIFVAESMDEAITAVDYGIRDYFAYRTASAPPGYTNPFGLSTTGEGLTAKQLVDGVNELGVGIIGTPDMVIEHIERRIEHTGGFGEVLFVEADWASPPAKKKMYELFAREVMPHFSADHSAAARRAEFDYMMSNREQLAQTFVRGVEKAKDDYAVEREARG
jgi:limonene 1,2-monooxygenase